MLPALQCKGTQIRAALTELQSHSGNIYLLELLLISGKPDQCYKILLGDHHLPQYHHVCPATEDYNCRQRARNNGCIQ